MKRREALILVLVCGLALTAAWCLWHATSMRRAVISAKDYTLRCEKLALQLRVLTPTSQPTDTKVIADKGDVIRRIETAAKEAGMRPEAILSVTPEAPRRIGDSGFAQHNHLVHLQSVSLQQVSSLAESVLGADPMLRVSAIAFSAPREPAPQQELWNVQLTFSRLTPSPMLSTGPVAQSR